MIRRMSRLHRLPDDLPASHPARVRPARPRRLGVLAAALLLVAACGAAPSASPSTDPTSSPTGDPPATPAPTAGPATAEPTPIPSGDLAALYREIEDQVLEIRELEAKERIEPVILSEAEVKQRIKEQFEKDNPADEIAVAEETLKALNLLPADADLGTLYVDLLGSQVAGFYDPETKELVVVSRSGKVGANEKVTFAHEFVHALQDQQFGLQGIDVDAVGQGDRSLGRLALVEGDATLAMTLWLSQHLGPDELQELLEIDPEAQEQLASMPAILRETLLFPYQQGLTFANGIWGAGGWSAIDEAYGRLPDSTEQVLHPEKYAAAAKPVAVALSGADLAAALGGGWSGTPDDTLGEFQLSVWLRENGVKALDASRAAAGWGGDRLAYLRGPDGAYGLALETAWDSAADADEFVAAAETAVRSLPGAARVERGADDRSAWVFVANDASTLAQLAGAARGLGI
jgi:hypothetical protein